MPSKTLEQRRKLVTVQILLVLSDFYSKGVKLRQKCKIFTMFSYKQNLNVYLYIYTNEETGFLFINNLSHVLLCKRTV